MFEKCLSNFALTRRLRQSTSTRLNENVRQFAVDIELHLQGRSIAHSDGLRIFVAVQPREGPFLESPLAGQTIKRLNLRGRASDRAHEPFLPVPRFLNEARIEKREQRVGGVAKPAIAIVPIAFTTDPFR